MTDTPNSSTDMEAHSGYGILPGDFIKPDPAMTPAESRDYVVAELRRWLTGDRICRHANEFGSRYESSQAVLKTHLSDGSWPAARLYMVLKALEREHTEVLPDDAIERLRHAGAWAAGICSDYLRGLLSLDTRLAAALALGFVQIDTLPSGGTIGRLVLPEAAVAVEALSSPSVSASSSVEEDPNSDNEAGTEGDNEAGTEGDNEAGAEGDNEGTEGDDEEGTEEEDVEVYDEEEEEEAPLQQNNGRTCAFLTTEYTVTLPGWALCAMASAATAWFLATLKG